MMESSVDAPPYVVVTIITYRRPEGLARLLTALQIQARAANGAFRLGAVVADNDAAGSAREIVAGFAGDPAFSVTYVVEPRQGIPMARNAALDNLPEDADFACLVDDDEWPTDDWAARMVEAQRRHKVDCIYGPVEPVYPSDPPKWMVASRVFERKKHADGATIGYAASNNAMISTAFLRKTGLRFDEGMRFTGGSDYRFFAQAIRLGLRIVWADRALVYDEVPANRMTWKWLMQRQYRLGNTFAVSARLDGKPGPQVRLFLYGLARIGLGVLMLPGFILGPYRGMRALVHILRGAGTAAGLVGHSHEEYAVATLNKSTAGSVKP